MIRLARYASEGMLVTGRHALSQPVHRRLGLIHKPLRGGLKHSCDAVELLIIAQATLRSFGVYNPVGYSNRRNQCHFWQEQSRSGLVPNINARSGLPQVPAVGKPLRTECGSIGHLVQGCRKRDDPSSNKETVPFFFAQSTIRKELAKQGRINLKGYGSGSKGGQSGQQLLFKPASHEAGLLFCSVSATNPSTHTL